MEEDVTMRKIGRDKVKDRGSDIGNRKEQKQLKDARQII